MLTVPQQTNQTPLTRHRPQHWQVTSDMSEGKRLLRLKGLRSQTDHLESYLKVEQFIPISSKGWCWVKYFYCIKFSHDKPGHSDDINLFKKTTRHVWHQSNTWNTLWPGRGGGTMYVITLSPTITSAEACKLISSVNVDLLSSLHHQWGLLTPLITAESWKGLMDHVRPGRVFSLISCEMSSWTISIFSLSPINTNKKRS